MADTDLGALVARVVADNEQFRSEMLKMTKQLESNTAKMNSALQRVNTQVGKMGSFVKGVTRLLAYFGVALGVRTLVSFTSQVIRSSRELDSLSRRLGGSVESLSELRYVAEQSDVQFTVLSLGLQRMTRRIAEAANGSGEAIGALKELGISAMSLSRLPLDQQFEVIADALAGVKNESHRVRLAMKLFDSEGVALLQTMDKGAAGIKAMRDEARALGVTLDSGAAASAAKAAQEADKFRAAASSLARDLTLKLVPALTTAVEWWRKFLFPGESDKLRRELEAALDSVDRIKRQIDSASGQAKRNLPELNRQLVEAQQHVLDIYAKVSEMEANGLGKDPFTTLRLPNLKQLAEANRLLGEMASKVLQSGVGPEGGIPDRLRPPSYAPEAQDTVRQAEESLTKFIQEQHDKRVTSAAQAAEAEAQLVFQSQQAQLQFRSEIAQAVASLAYALFGEQKAVALAAIAFEKLMAVKRIKITVEQAAWGAFASQLVPGDPSSLFRAQAARTAVRAQGAVSIARTVALSVLGGLAEAANVLRSSGAPGSFTNPLSTTGGTSLAGGSSAASAAHQERVVQVIFRGPVYGWDDYIQNRVVAGLRDAIQNHEVVLIDQGTRQAGVLGI